MFFYLFSTLKMLTSRCFFASFIFFPFFFLNLLTLSEKLYISSACFLCKKWWVSYWTIWSSVISALFCFYACFYL
ncbi:Uncharacterized protein TCM_015644 [Theobroma cacao]|uniref:Uncharacterized protein n=1 Tax=Theobroma cacao TaxID=3641 RepID=A0A061G3A4_THECC|nr:Uncharacterized protein TCM_015644 [Theobroma cacao]